MLAIGEEEKELPKETKDFSELAVVYLCKAGELEEEGCSNFFSGRNGSCTFKSFSIPGERAVCNYTLREKE
jgi:hypothetical protein